MHLHTGLLKMQLFQINDSVQCEWTADIAHYVLCMMEIQMHNATPNTPLRTFNVIGSE